MVEVTIFIEGGTLNDPTGGTELLREGFHKLLAPTLTPHQPRLIIEMRGPNNQTVKDFNASIKKNPNLLILLDLDAAESERKNKLAEFQLLVHAKKVFFMIQAMEAWILSQPDKIEEYVESNFIISKRRKNTPLKEDDLLKDRHPKNIVAPARILNILLQRYFEIEKRGIVRKLKYRSKLRDGSAMLELLELKKLSKDFSDVAILIDTLTQKVRPPNA